MSTQRVADQPEKPQPEPVEDPTGRGSLGQFAKRGAEGVQVLADKMTGQDTARYTLQQPGHAFSKLLQYGMDAICSVTSWWQRYHILTDTWCAPQY